jgi:hypothetical protein
MSKHARVVLAALAGVLCACTGASADNDGSIFVYHGNGVGHFDVRFMSPDDTMLIVESDANWNRTARLIDRHGDEQWQASLEGLRATALGENVLIDETHIALPRLRTASPEYAIVPAATEPSALARAFQGWISRAGGLRGDGAHEFSAATNVFANQSCALGADGGSAAWRHERAESFRAAPARTVLDDGPEGLHFVELFCLVAEDRQFIAVAGLEKTAPVGRKSVVLIYEAGQGQPQLRVNLVLEGQEVLPRLHQVGPDVLVGLYPSSLPERDGAWIATRIRFRDGEWRVEQAFLSENPRSWQSDFRLMALREDQFWFSTPDGIFSVAWPDGAAVVPFTPVQVIAAQTEFERRVVETGQVLISPSGERIAWIDTRGGGEVRVLAMPSALRRRE